MIQDPSILDLREIVRPDPVGMGPETWGWYGLFACAAGLAGVGVWLVARRYVARRYRRAALRELEGCGDVAAIAVLVKRVCLSAYPRQEVAGLSGAAWTAFLDSTVAGGPFTSGPGRVLAEHYGREIAGDAVVELRETVAAWIRGHRADRRGREGHARA